MNVRQYARKAIAGGIFLLLVTILGTSLPPKDGRNEDQSFRRNSDESNTSKEELTVFTQNCPTCEAQARIYRKMMKIADERRDLMRESQFQLNVTAARSTPLDRDLPRTMDTECLRKSYEQLFLAEPMTVSVIVPVYNEDFSMLLRTITSVMNRTPNSLLKEIILVDDASDYPFLGEPLDQYVETEPKLKLFRQTKREGLIRTRLHGAAHADGEILLFLDAHTEVNRGWLEPLVQEISRNQKTVAIPSIDVLNTSTMAYFAWEGSFQGSFTWSLDVEWSMRSRQKEVEPYTTAITIGCAMAIHREFFFDIGGFDDQLFGWGGENIEISLKTWMCGGRLVICPCSRVAHIFRTYLPYRLPEKTGIQDEQELIRANLERVSLIWMDDMARYVKSALGDIGNQLLTGDDIKTLNERKQRLRGGIDPICPLSFDWYLTHITPDIQRPTPTTRFSGELQNLASLLCTSPQYEAVSTRTNTISVENCIWKKRRQQFSLEENGHLKQGENCVYIERNLIDVGIRNCEETTEFPRVWYFNRTIEHSVLQRIRLKFIPVNKRNNFGRLQSKEVPGYCLSQITKSKSQILGLYSCSDSNNAFSVWRFTNTFQMISKGTV